MHLSAAKEAPCLRHDVSALCHPFVHGAMLMNSSNSLTWTSQHFHCRLYKQEERNFSLEYIFIKVAFINEKFRGVCIVYTPLSFGRGKQQVRDGNCMHYHDYPFLWRFHRTLYFCRSGARLFQLSSLLEQKGFSALANLWLSFQVLDLFP